MWPFSSSANFSAKDIPSLADKVILVTGGNNGIGKETIVQLARHQPKNIYLAARTESKAKDAIAEIKSQTPDVNIKWLPLDLTSLASIKEAAEQVNRTTDRLDVLVLNAGIMATPPGKTESGQDIQLGTNHVGHFLLTKLLLPTLQKTAAMPDSDVRVIAVASEAHNLAPGIDTIISTEKLVKTSPWTRYGASKASNIMFAAEMARRYPNISSVSLHPGVIMTDLYAPSKQSSWFMKQGLSVVAPIFFMDVPGGALNQLWAGAGAKKEEIQNGNYYTPVGVLKSGNSWAKNKEYGRKLWEWTEKELAEAGY